jgi:hypothetical protein
MVALRKGIVSFIGWVDQTIWNMIISLITRSGGSALGLSAWQACSFAGDRTEKFNERI